MAIPVGENPTKEIHDTFFTFKGKIIETKWTAFGRTDLAEYPGIPDHMDIYVDGTAGFPMYRFSGNINDPALPSIVSRMNFQGTFHFNTCRMKKRTMPSL